MNNQADKADLSAAAEALLESFKQEAIAYRRNSGWSTEGVSPEVPKKDFHEFQYVYFMRVDHAGADAPHWCRGELIWDSTTAQKGADGDGSSWLTSTFRIPKQRYFPEEVNYGVWGRRYGDILHFHGENKSGTSGNSDHFVAVFNASLQENKILAGIWCGKDFNKNPSSGPMLLSHEDLREKPKVIQDAAHAAMLRSLVSVDAAVDFGE